MFFRIRLLIVFFLIIVIPGLAQNIERRLEHIEEAFYEEDFVYAFEEYSSLLSSGYTLDNHALFQAEVCSLLTDYPEKSLDNFHRLGDAIKSKDKFYNYWRGRVMMKRYEFDEAVQAFTSFLATKAYLSKEIRKEVREWMDLIEKIKNMIGGPQQYDVYRLPDLVNSSSAEFNPIYKEKDKSLYFLSNKGNSQDNNYKIYKVEYQGDGKWNEPYFLKSIGSLQGLGTCLQVSETADRIFLHDDEMQNVFYSQPIDGITWKKPVELNKSLNLGKSTSQFYINSSADRIIFSSNIGSKKKPNFDLLEINLDKKTGKWSKPESLPSVINTIQDEESPFFDEQNNILYFSSNREESIGGFDIFKASYDSKKNAWSVPEHLGYPINSIDNEFNFNINAEDYIGFFSSDRLESTGDYDLFFFNKSYKIPIKGKIFIQGTEDQVLSDAQIFFRVIEEPETSFYSSVKSGEYETEIYSNKSYQAEITKDGAILYQEKFSIDAKIERVSSMTKDYYVNYEGGVPLVSKQVFKQSSQSEEEKIVNLGSKFRKSNKAILKNIYFDEATSYLKQESVDALKSVKSLLREYPAMKIEIAGHSDSLEDRKYKEDVSLNRATLVRTWLILSGIDKGRMIAKGYGDKSPLASNDDEREGRELNRRIEIVVLE